MRAAVFARLGAAVMAAAVVAGAGNLAGFPEGAAAFKARDFAAAARLWRPLAEEGHLEAQFGLGEIHERGGNGVARDYVRAAEWYLLAAEQGLADAQFNLGNLFGLGKGVAQDAKQTIEWHLKAAAQGHARAQLSLGRSYESGAGVPQDYAEAAAWYRKAAEQGDADAQVSLAALYRYGLGVARNRAQAVEWYRRAAVEGDRRARFHLSVLEPGKSFLEDEPSAAPAAGGFRVQLAAFRARESASRAWGELRAAHGDILGTLDSTIVRTDLGQEKGIYFRLLAGPMESQKAAWSLCAALKQREIDCFVPRQ